MSRTIHVNLLRNSERRSSLPVRMRVMVPALSSLLLLGFLVWAWFLSSRNADLVSGRDDILAKQDNQKAAIADYREIKKREGAVRGELEQLESYSEGRILFSSVLAGLPLAVPSTMQLTSLEIPPPPRPVQAKPEKQASGNSRTDEVKKPSPKEKRRGEKVFLKLSGLVDSAPSVDALRAALRSGIFTNLVVSTEIPKGAFRISGEQGSKFVFEVNCECIERVFK